MTSLSNTTSEAFAAETTTFKDRCRFLELPVELRLNIYEFTFDSFTLEDVADEDWHYLTAILYTNRQFLREAGRTFQGREQEIVVRSVMSNITCLPSVFAPITPELEVIIERRENAVKHVKSLCENAKRWIKRAESN